MEEKRATKKRPITQAKREADKRYHAKAYELVSFRARREEHLNERINLAAERAGISRAQYILDAIRAKLDADGIEKISDPTE